MSRIGNGVAKVALPENWANVPTIKDLEDTEKRLQNNIDTGDATLQSNLDTVESNLNKSIKAEETRATEKETELNNKFNSYTPTINIPQIKVDNAGHADTATKATQDANGKDIDATYAKKENSYTREEIDQKVASVYKYMGSVATKEELLALPTESLVIGYVYDVKSTGLNYAWNGTSWDELGMEIDLSLYAKKTDVPGIKVDNAGHADNADNATEADNAAKLNGVEAKKYALKTEVSSAQGVFDVLYPISTPTDTTTYMQAPGGLPPREHFLRMGIVSDWKMVETEGEFIRFPGGKASAFGSGIQAEQIGYHSHGMDHKHNKGTMNITGSFSMDGSYGGVRGTALTSGAFSRGSYLSGGVDFASASGCMLDFNANNSGAWTGSTSSPLNPIYPDSYSKTSTDYYGSNTNENRPKNRTWNLWKRIA